MLLTLLPYVYYKLSSNFIKVFYHFYVKASETLEFSKHFENANYEIVKRSHKKVGIILWSISIIKLRGVISITDNKGLLTTFNLFYCYRSPYFLQWQELVDWADLLLWVYLQFLVFEDVLLKVIARETKMRLFNTIFRYI